MKVTVAFLNKKLSNSIRESMIYKVVSNWQAMLYIIGLTLLFSFLVRFIKISPSVLNFATNFRQAENNSLDISDVISVFSLYNNDNYIFDNVQVANENNKDENKDQLDIIDSFAEGKESEAVFSKTEHATITDNNSTLQRVSIGDVRILNYSSNKNIDFDGILSGNVTLTKKSDKILLYNTHTSESYSNSEKYKFDYTGTKRTTDANYNMLRIAKDLEKNLTAKGFDAIQNTTPHDYGTYTSAYAKSRITVKDAIATLGRVGISIDVHRDAAADLEFRPVVQIKGVQVAQCMLVMGIGNDSSKNQYWQENLKLAIKLQQIADEVYPGLFRPMYIRNSVYNQDLNKYSILIEIGATGNTIDEALLSTRCIANLLNILYKD